MLTPLPAAKKEFLLIEPITEGGIVAALDLGYRRFLDAPSSPILPACELEFHLTSKNALSLRLDSILEVYLMSLPYLNSLLISQIVTSTHEAISNGILWGNLALNSVTFRERTMAGEDLIAERLLESSCSLRPLSIGIQSNHKVVKTYVASPYLELEEDLFPDAPQNPWRGTSIIKTFADNVEILEDGQMLRLTYQVGINTFQH